jgi:D-amino-acid oxidase
LTLRELERIAMEEPTAGVMLVEGIEASGEEVEVPSWAFGVYGFRMCASDELPPGFVTGWRYRLPLMEMPVYLRYLERRLAEAGTVLEIGRQIGRFDEVTGIAPIVVNCTGLAAGNLVQDTELVAVRGQLVVVKNPGVDYFFQDNADGEEITYFLPHGDHVVLRGTLDETPGVDGQPNPLVRQRIIERCARVEPRLANPSVIEDRVGFRPARSMVRLERDGNVIHNYGHGGSGVTLSWGCAQEVLALIAST